LFLLLHSFSGAIRLISLMTDPYASSKPAFCHKTICLFMHCTKTRPNPFNFPLSASQFREPIQSEMIGAASFPEPVLSGKKKKTAPEHGLSYDLQVNYLTESLSVLEALKTGTFVALILMVSFVRGLMPVRAALFLTLNFPKPLMSTTPPFSWSL